MANRFVIFSGLLYGVAMVLHYKTGEDVEGNSCDVMEVVSQRVIVEWQRKSTKTSIPAES